MTVESHNAAKVPVRRIAKRFSDVPRPFLKWVGSKQGLLNHLTPFLPPSYDRYYEPFLGGGALFFYECPSEATLSDQSAELISVWQVIRDDPEGIIDYLRDKRPDRDLFYEIREARSTDKTTFAAEFIYLNKTCWNGLYRVNSKGKFNVPFGRSRTDSILDAEKIRACSRALRAEGVIIENKDFRESVSDAKRGDLVFFDPPYVTKHNNNGFRDWNEVLFSWDDQVSLAAEARRLADRGVHVIISNADHKDIRDLYNGFEIIGFNRSSTLSSSPKFRGSVGEIIVVAGV